jgi:hypothetical protein
LSVCYRKAKNPHGQRCIGRSWGSTLRTIRYRRFSRRWGRNPYKAPALVIQKETVRAILHPIGRSAPDVAGVVDFYIMPAYDDIARLTFYDDSWHLRHMFPGSPDVGARRRDQPLSREALQAVLEAMTRNAA